MPSTDISFLVTVKVRKQDTTFDLSTYSGPAMELYADLADDYEHIWGGAPVDGGPPPSLSRSTISSKLWGTGGDQPQPGFLSLWRRVRQRVLSNIKLAETKVGASFIDGDGELLKSTAKTYGNLLLIPVCRGVAIPKSRLWSKPHCILCTHTGLRGALLKGFSLCPKVCRTLSVSQHPPPNTSRGFV